MLDTVKELAKEVMSVIKEDPFDEGARTRF